MKWKSAMMMALSYRTSFVREMVDIGSPGRYLSEIEKMGRLRGPRPVPYIETINKHYKKRRERQTSEVLVIKDSRPPKHSPPEPIESETGQFKIYRDAGMNFTSIGGYDGVKNEMKQVAHMMMYPGNYTRYNVRVPRGILLEGPPGNGKTLMARCFAGEIDAGFVHCSGAEFNEKYIGVGASRLRELFKLARENPPCVLFIDEFDAIGRKRGDDLTASERDTTLNQLLVLMDGFESQDNVLIIGATNRIDILDKAAIRPGRFDKIIHIPDPDVDTRRAILAIHLKNKPIDVEVDELVSMTYGFNGAMIENLLNEATLMGIRNQRLPVSKKDVEMIRQRMVFGVSVGKKNISDDTKKRIAVHEAGHFIVAIHSKYYEKPIKITIDTSDMQSLGMTIFQPADMDNGIFIREYLDDKIMVLLGGRAAEEIIYGKSMSSGSVSDLESVIQLVKRMYLQFGMGDSIIYPLMSEHYKEQIDQEIHQYINTAYEKTRQIVLANIHLIYHLVDHLMTHSTLEYDDITRIQTELIDSDILSNKKTFS